MVGVHLDCLELRLVIHDCIHVEGLCVGEDLGTLELEWLVGRCHLHVVTLVCWGAILDCVPVVLGLVVLLVQKGVKNSLRYYTLVFTP